MDEKMEATQERGLIEIHLTVGKGIRFFFWARKVYVYFGGKLEPLPKSPNTLFFQDTILIKGMKRLGLGR